MAGGFGFTFERLAFASGTERLVTHLSRLLIKSLGGDSAFARLIVRLTHDLTLDNDLGRETAAQTGRCGIASLPQRCLGVHLRSDLTSELLDLGGQFGPAGELRHAGPGRNVVLSPLALFVRDPRSLLGVGRGEDRGCQAVLSDLSVKDALTPAEVLSPLALTLLTGRRRVEPGSGRFFGRGELSP